MSEDKKYFCKECAQEKRDIKYCDRCKKNTKLYPSEVKRRLLIQSENKLFRIGSTINKTFEGSYYYLPSEVNFTDQSGNKIEIDHISFHRSGATHVKFKNSNKEIIETVTDRQELKNLGYQDFITDTIIDLYKLPNFNKEVSEFDYVFKIPPDLKEPINFHISMVSGRLIIKDLQREGSILGKKDIKELLGFYQGCMGWHSDNADKLIQYSLSRSSNINNLYSNRRIMIYKDMKIARGEI